MNLRGFEKISANCDILIPIFKLLKFRDQLRLSRASVQLRTIFENFIWPEKYRVMQIIYDYGDIIVKGELGSNLIKLKAAEVPEFLQHYGDDVLELTVRNFSADLKIFETVRLRNLKILRYIDVRLSKRNIELMPLHYPKLQELLFHNSCASKSLQMFGTSILSFDTLSQMKNLRRVSENSSRQSAIVYEHFRLAVGELKLQSLQLSALIIPDKCVREVAKSPKLSDLCVETSFDRRKWSKNFSSFLANFVNLVSLSIRFCDVLNDATLKTISETCKHLENYTIRKTSFGSIKSFSIPAKVTELTLDECENVTGDILRQMLTQLKIHTFCAKSTYIRKFKDFKISPLIHSLDIDGLKTHKFKSAYKDNPNLKQLTWRGSLYGENVKNPLAEVYALATCCNLQVLDIKSGTMPLLTLLQLSLLKNLTLSWSMAGLSWSYITSLLKQPSLRYFNIIDHVIRSPRLVDSDVPVEGFKTNVQVLTIPFDAFREGLNFWLDLFRRNEKLALVCSNFEDFGDYDRFLRTMIDHECFPTNLRSIEVWGFTISCNDIRKRFRTTMVQLDSKVRYSERNLNYEIVLCRNKQQTDNINKF